MVYQALLELVDMTHDRTCNMPLQQKMDTIQYNAALVKAAR